MSENNNSKKSVDGQMNGHQNNKFKKHKNKVYNSRFESADKVSQDELPKETFKPVNNKVYERDLKLDNTQDEFAQDRNNEYRPRQNYNNRNENGEYRPRQNYNNRNENGEYRPRQKYNNRNENGEYRPRQNYNNNYDSSDSTIKVNNLDKNLDENTLRELFSQFGRVNRVSLPRDSRSGQPRGFAYVTFAARSEAESAFENLQGHTCGHLLLRLEWAESYKQKSNNGEHRPRQDYNNNNREYRQNYNNRNNNKFEKKDSETIEEIEKLLNSGKFLHQTKKEELEKKLSDLKEYWSPKNQFPTLASNSESLNISSDNPWSKTKDTKVMSDEGVKEANEVAKKIYIENINKQKLKKLELQQKKLDAKNKLSYEDDYYGEEFFEDEDADDNNDFFEAENVISYDENYEDI